MMFNREADSLKAKAKPAVANVKLRKRKPRKVQCSLVSGRGDAQDMNGPLKRAKTFPAATRRSIKDAVKRLKHAVTQVCGNDHSFPYKGQHPMELARTAIAYFTRAEWAPTRIQTLVAWKTWWAA